MEHRDENPIDLRLCDGCLDWSSDRLLDEGMYRATDGSCCRFSPAVGKYV